MTFVGPVFAQDAGFYIGAALGQAQIDVDCTGASTCDDKDSNWKILGGYQFNKNFAVELGYTDLGESSFAGSLPPFGTVTATLESTAWELVAVGILPLADRFSVYGKIGMYRAETDFSGSVSGLGSVSESDSNTDLTFGIGVRFDFTKNLGVRGEWQRYSDVGPSDLESDLDVISVGVIWKF